MVAVFHRTKRFIGVFVVGVSLSVLSPWTWARADVQMYEHIFNSDAPAHLQQLARQLLTNFRYRAQTPRAWVGSRDKQGRLVGNCTVFARASAGALSAKGHLPRFVNVQVRSPAPGQDSKHVVTVVTSKDHNRWVFDNRPPYLYPYSMLASLYHRKQTVRFSGVQRQSWSSVKNTIE